MLPECANKPEIILYYNDEKKGNFTMDEAIEEFTCRRKTVRWPLLLFFNILDVAAYNAFLLMKKDGCKKTRKQFLKSLAP